MQRMSPPCVGLSAGVVLLTVLSVVVALAAVLSALVRGRGATLLTIGALALALAASVRGDRQRAAAAHELTPRERSADCARTVSLVRVLPWAVSLGALMFTVMRQRRRPAAPTLR